MIICSVPPLHGLGWTVAARKCAKSNNPCSQKDEDNSWRIGPLVVSKCDNHIRASHCYDWMSRGNREEFLCMFYISWGPELIFSLGLLQLGYWADWKICSFVHQPCAFSAPKHSLAFGAVTCTTTSRCSCATFQNRYWFPAAGMIGLSRDSRKLFLILLHFFIFLVCSLCLAM